ncbi:zinc finger, CCHC-type containing protein [Tanacetum coccineum]
MVEEDALLVDDVEGGLCVNYTDAGIGGRCYSGSNKNKGKKLWDSLESKYIAEDSSSKKFLVSNFNNYKMVDSKPIMEQYNELLKILGQYTQHGLKMDESISVASIIDKLHPSWKDFKHTLKHRNDDLSLVQLGSHMRIKESLRVQESDKGKGFGYYNNGMFMLNLNKVPDDLDSVYMSSSAVVNSSLWHARLGHVHYKRMLEMSKDELIPAIDENPDKCTLTCRDDLSDDVPREFPGPRKGKRVLGNANNMVLIFNIYLVEVIKNSVLERSKLMIEIGSIVENNYMGLIDIPLGFDKDDDSIDSIPMHQLLYTILVINKLDVKTAFFKVDFEEEVYMKQPEGFVMSDHNQVDKTKKFLSSRFSMKDMGEADVILGIKIKRQNKGIVITQYHYIEKILKKFNREDCSPVSTPIDPVEKLKPNTGKPVDQLDYSRAIGCLMYVMTSTRPNIAYAVGRLSRFTSNPSRQHCQAITRVFKYLKGTMNYGLSYLGYPSMLEGYSDASWINHVKDSSSTSGWVFLLGGGAISWDSKKQTCITGSTIEFKFVALAATVEGSRDQVGSQYSYCYNIEEDPKTYDEAMQSRDAAFWKEAVDDEIGSIMKNNT